MWAPPETRSTSESVLFLWFLFFCHKSRRQPRVPQLIVELLFFFLMANIPKTFFRYFLRNWVTTGKIVLQQDLPWQLCYTWLVVKVGFLCGKWVLRHFLAENTKCAEFSVKFKNFLKIFPEVEKKRCKEKHKIWRENFWRTLEELGNLKVILRKFWKNYKKIIWNNVTKIIVEKSKKFRKAEKFCSNFNDSIGAISKKLWYNFYWWELIDYSIKSINQLFYKY